MEEQASTYAEFESFDFENNPNFQNGWLALAHVIDPSKIGIEYLKAKVFFFSKYHKPFGLEKYLSWKKEKVNTNDGESSDARPDATKESHLENALNYQQNDSRVKKDSLAFCSDSVPQSNDSNCVMNNETLDNVKSGNTNNAADTITTVDDSTMGDISTLLQHTSLEQGDEMDSGNAVMNNAGKENNKTENEHSDKADEGKTSTSVSASGDGVQEEEEEPTLSLLEVASYIQNGIPIPGLVSMEVQPTNQAPTPSLQERKQKPWEVRVAGQVES